MTIKVEVLQACDALKNYGFRDQLTRSILSVPSNIAEGAERPEKAEFRQFLGYAKGSAGETRTQIMIGAGLEYFKPDTADQWINELREIFRMLFGLRKSL